MPLYVKSRPPVQDQDIVVLITSILTFGKGQFRSLGDLESEYLCLRSEIRRY